MISLAKQFLFVHVPKTGGNSVQSILIRYSEDRITTNENQDGVERFGIESPTAPIRKHSLLKVYRESLAPDVFGGLFKFGTVRNPWERLVSNYFSPYRGAVRWDRGAFLELVYGKPTPLMYLTLDGTADGPVGVDMIMRYENLAEDFVAACRKIGIPEEPLPRRNVSSRDHDSAYYDDELVEIVAERCAREIAMFGYRFERNG